MEFPKISLPLQSSNTVRLVQLVEHQIVVLVVVGSSPTSHPCCNSRRNPRVALFYGSCKHLGLRRLEKRVEKAWGKDAIGVSYTYLKNLNISEDKPYRNDKCIIRRGIIVTSPKK